MKALVVLVLAIFSGESDVLENVNILLAPR